MRGRRSIAGLIALWMLASGCGNQVTPTHPSQTAEISAGGLNASGSGSSGTFTLQVTKNGSGSGTVTSSPSGISCGTTCSRSFSGGTTVTLTAVPAAGSVFAGWSGGGCAGTGSCTVQINNNMTVSATFNTSDAPPPPPSGTFTLTVTKVQNGFQNLFASGGRTPYNWSVTGGQLHPGLRIIRASNGNRIEGTPTARGTFTFNLTVRDQDGQQATQVTTITIN